PGNACVRVPQARRIRSAREPTRAVRFGPPPCWSFRMNAIDINVLRVAAPPSASDEAGPAPKRTVAGFGFWIYLLSDIVMFSALFATYAVLAHATAGGPTGAQLFNLRNAALETAFLLLSSYSCGLMSLAINSRHQLGT